ncbi:MAG: FtsW/RodA/SpoVE family cell cycle protein [Micrococcales bacterium]|nr:FtsW/RodA/SpoVE family cell cycle protein [Micrococcales bacterium]MBT5397577.1 FtsW/RodA/SpoVE family cell cycle protein [Micrococcales bacterium]MBT5431399.1 FtsW/RodA/SpoVE family cell cycle protein [Micrococcales bacterium]MBT7925519.1 FtsW/RodA/SpoVE family cell cycle protein [Micrococcales bacterium]
MLLKAVPRSRNFEAVLLFWVAGIHAFALSQIQLAVNQVMSWDMLLYWAPPTVSAWILHYVLRKYALNADGLLLPLAFLLNGLGIAMIYRLDLAEITRGGTDLFAERQVWLSCFAMLIAAVVVRLIPNPLTLRRFPYLAGAGAVILLMLPAAPVIGRTVNGATLWVGIGELSFQPGEIAKILLAIFFAGYLVSRKGPLSEIGSRVLGMKIPGAKDLGPVLLFWVASIGVLVIQRDLGTSILYFGLFLVMIYTATGRAFYVGIGMVMMITGALVASRLFDYVGSRFESWLNPLSQENYTAAGGSYQLVQGLFGMAHGDVIGSGLGSGFPQLIPLAESDFIFAALGEELGLAGVFAILAIYLLIVYRGLRVANTHQDEFSKLLALGLAFVIGLQVFIVCGGVMGLLPLTGLTTPFLAAGGSSLLANWSIIGLLLVLSDSSLKRVSA